MWIMLTTKLPTNPSPPNMSLFWSEPCPHLGYARKQKKQIKDGFLEDFGGECYYSNFAGFIKEPRWDQARRIVHKDQQIRVFPHEFSELTTKKIKMYLDGSHELVPGNVAEQDIMDSLLRGSKKRVYEAALVEGCTEYEARLMALGADISEGHYEIPAIGWYRIRPEYGLTFCNEKELEE